MDIFLGFVIGVMCSAAFFAIFAHEKQRRTVHKADPQAFWDVHAVLNAVNRVAIANGTDNQPSPELLYCLGDHLRYAALLQQQNGWLNPQQLDDWLIAILGLHQHLCESTKTVTTSIQISPEIGRLQIDPLALAIIGLLRGKPSLEDISIVALQPSGKRGRKQNSVARVSARVKFLGKNDLSDPHQHQAAPRKAAQEGVALDIDLPSEPQPLSQELSRA